MTDLTQVESTLDESKFVTFPDSPFRLYQPFEPAGDQPAAIKQLVEGIQDGLSFQTLLGVTGSGKTFTMANVIARLGRPAIVFAPNKTLAAQLYSEFRDFFPLNAVEYFVSYYDYYQPEAYVPQRDLFIEKDSAINEHIEQMRLSCTKSLMERRDVVIVATVSAIYGIGNPNEYHQMILTLRAKDRVSQRDIIARLIQMQYTRNDIDFDRGTFRVRGDTIDIFPAEHAELAVRVDLFDDEIDTIQLFDPLTGRVRQKIPRFTVYPGSHYVTPRSTVLRAIETIKEELRDRLDFFRKENKLVEEQRLEQRTRFDLEMMAEIGFTKGIENYSRYFDQRKPGQRPFCLLDFFPEDFLMVVDESHASMPQIRAMYGGDRSRKEALVEYGFRLPSAMDNRPLKFQEFEDLVGQTIFVSATPSDYELQLSEGVVVEQIIRPTGLLDPLINVRPTKNQIDDLMDEVYDRIKKQERTLITTLTKRMAEELSKYMDRVGIKCRYIHSEIKTLERVEILRELRLGVIDVLVGVNLLREGLDLPEVSLVAIMDADKEGFLRDIRSLIQTIGRAARNENGKVIMYADRMTGSMEKAINETNRRRERQMAYNTEHGITPKTIWRSHDEIMEQTSIADKMAKPMKSYGITPKESLQAADPLLAYMSKPELKKQKESIQKEMERAARELDFPLAAKFRDELLAIDKLLAV